MRKASMQRNSQMSVEIIMKARWQESWSMYTKIEFAKLRRVIGAFVQAHTFRKKAQCWESITFFTICAAYQVQPVHYEQQNPNQLHMSRTQRCAYCLRRTEGSWRRVHDRKWIWLYGSALRRTCDQPRSAWCRCAVRSVAGGSSNRRGRFAV